MPSTYKNFKEQNILDFKSLKSNNYTNIENLKEELFNQELKLVIDEIFQKNILNNNNENYINKNFFENKNNDLNSLNLKEENTHKNKEIDYEKYSNYLNKYKELLMFLISKGYICLKTNFLTFFQNYYKENQEIFDNLDDKILIMLFNDQKLKIKILIKNCK